MTVEAVDVEIISEDIPGWVVANEGNLTVALDVTITPELHNEAIARELVKNIQGIRKESGFDITDRINVVVSDVADARTVIRQFGEYISNQVLANSLTAGDATGGKDVEIDSTTYTIKVSRL